jgi:hypothetical protein
MSFRVIGKTAPARSSTKISTIKTGPKDRATPSRVRKARGRQYARSEAKESFTTNLAIG